MLSQECVETVKLCGREHEYTVSLYIKRLKIMEPNGLSRPLEKKNEIMATICRSLMYLILSTMFRIVICSSIPYGKTKLTVAQLSRTKSFQYSLAPPQKYALYSYQDIVFMRVPLFTSTTSA